MTPRLTDSDVRFMIGRQPSLKDKCPREGCGQRLEPALCETAIVWTCPEQHYSAREVSGTTKLAFHEAQAAHIRLLR